MTEMPSSQTPLYHHPLPALEHWLEPVSYTPLTLPTNREA